MNKSLLLALALTASLLCAQEDFSVIGDTSSFREKLLAHSKTINTLASSFTQEKHLDILTDTIKSEGYFNFKNPDKVRWEYFKPYPYLFVLNGKNIRIKTGKKSQHYDIGSNRIFGEINSLMVSLIKGDILGSDSGFSLRYLEDNRSYLIMMKPLKKKMAEFMQGVRIYLTKDGLAVSRLEITESAGDYTKIFFNGTKTNEPLDEDIFSVK